MELAPASAPDSDAGQHVVGLGDIDADGFEDFAVSTSTHLVYLYRGNAPGIFARPDQTISIVGSDEFGWAIDGAGDVNGDGYWDMIVGSPSVRSTSGQAYVFHGSASGLSMTASTVLQVAGMRSDGFGLSVAGGSDVDGDGFSDVIVASGFSPHSVRLFRGGTAGVSVGAARIYSSIYSAETLALPGDLDVDGLGEVVIASIQYDAYRGRVYLFRGATMSSVLSTYVDGTAGSCQLGYNIAR